MKNCLAALGGKPSNSRYKQFWSILLRKMRI